MSSEPHTQAAFELLRLSAVRVTADVAVVEVEGRFARASGRFARRPQLVLESAGGRVQHDPVHREASGGRWRGTYAVPADALDNADSLALGIRGALLELPAPDVGEGDRFAALARETNALRRALEAAELDAAEAEGRLRERVDAAEHAAITAREEARAEAERVREESAAELARAREESAAELTRVREESAAELERVREEAAAQLDQARGESEAELARGREEAEARAAAAEERAGAAEERAAALEIDAATARDAQADQRRRSEAAVAELQASLEQARAGEPRTEGQAPAGEPRTEGQAPAGEDTEPLGAEAPAADETQPLALAAGAPGGGDEPTQAVPVLGRRRHAEPPPPEGWVPIHREPSAARWVAVAALLLCFVVLLLLLGFL